MEKGGKFENKKKVFEKGTRKEREKQQHCNMSGGAAKRAKRGEKAQLSESGQAVLNAMIAGDGNAFHEAFTAPKLLPQRLDKPAPGMSAPEAKLQKSAKSGAARVALRAVLRANNCVNSTQFMMTCEKQCRESAFKDFKRQLDEMDKDETVDTEEYDDVIKTMKLLETHYKKEAFGN